MRKTPRDLVSNLNAVSQTLLIPLYFRAMESHRPDALVRDPKAVELVSRLDYDFSGIQRLKNEQVNYLLRMREFDRLARAFLAEHPDGVIVDLGCGLDTRFERVDNGQVEWYGLDLPEVIELRKALLDETPRSHVIGCSMLDFSWMDALSGQVGKPLLFLAEAVLVYLEEADVKRLVQALAERFAGAELVCEAYSPVVIRFHPRPPAVARPRWGLKDDRDVEAWVPGIRLLSRWYYFDKPEPRLGAFQIMRYFPFLARVARVVHYRLGEAAGREGLFLAGRKEVFVHAKPNFIAPLSDTSAGLSRVGGKGASLARMATAGLPVPPGFYITTAAYRRFVAEHDLQEQILAAAATASPDQPATVEEASRRIVQLFIEHSMAEDMAEEIRRGYAELGGGDVPVAVRSSATAEDLPEASFAGQQETYLNLRGNEAVLEAVKKCWASLWTARAIAYRSRHEIAADSVSLAVVVQKLVIADATGILFTANPLTGRREEIVINAAWGLGEAIVSGAVTPDTLTVEKATGRIINRVTAKKQVMTVLAEMGTREMPVPEHQKQKAVLSDVQATELAKLGADIEKLYGMPLDIEWALAAGKFAILQARPITALPPAEPAAPLTWPKPPRGIMYGRTSFAEQIPNPVSPLFATLGLRMADIPTQELMRRFTKAKINYAYIPINGYVFMVAGMSFPELVAYLRMTAQITPMVLRGQEHCRAARQEFVRVIGEWEAKDIAVLSPSELLAGAGTVFQAAVRFYTYIQAGTVPLSTGSETCFTQFYNRLVRRKGDPPATTFLFGSETVALRAEKALFDLAAWCRERPTLADYLRQTPASQVAQALSQPQPPANLPTGDWYAWLAQFQAYLAEHGQMTYDLDFANPVPAEQPSVLLETVKMYLLSGGGDPYARNQATLERRNQATAAILARLHWPLKGWFQGLLRWAQNAAPGREDSLADLGLGHPLIRRYLNELGRRLAAGGVIPNAESIYWLEEAEVQEVIAALEASEPLPDLSSRIPSRKAERQHYLKITPPALLPEKSKLSIMVPWHRASDDQSILHGIGTSAGQVTAPACVLIGPEDFPRMRPGDVLVAVTPTPAWTPLFAMASAVVTDIGGPLSHSSIVAREYGIPAVMATGSATRRIRTGQMITVDGNGGTVTLKE